MALITAGQTLTLSFNDSVQGMTKCLGKPELQPKFERPWPLGLRNLEGKPQQNPGVSYVWSFSRLKVDHLGEVSTDLSKPLTKKKVMLAHVGPGVFPYSLGVDGPNRNQGFSNVFCNEIDHLVDGYNPSENMLVSWDYSSILFPIRGTIINVPNHQPATYDKVTWQSQSETANHWRVGILIMTSGISRRSWGWFFVVFPASVISTKYWYGWIIC